VGGLGRKSNVAKWPERNGTVSGISDMPTVSEWANSLRAAFGERECNEQWRKGLRADCPAHLRVYACEGGREVGQRYVPDPAKVVSRLVTGSFKNEVKK
jgi:hypothetical protein